MTFSREIQTTPEDVLIQQSAMGSSQEFSALYQKYLPLIYKTWHRFRLAELSLEDWKQEAAIVLFRSASSYGRQNVRFCWYYRQALLNRIRDLYRQQAAKKRIPSREIEELTDVHIDRKMVDPHHRPDEVSEYRSSYSSFFNNCSLFEQSVFILVNRGYNYEEVAKRMSRSTRSTRSAFERARQKFLKHMF